MRAAALALGAALAACAPGESGGGARLVDVTAEAGIDFVHAHGGAGKKFLFETMGSGVAIADFDDDARPDLLFLQSGTLPPAEFGPAERERARHAAGATHRIYRNAGGMRFEDRTAGSGLEEPMYAMGPAVGDVDADGDRDVYVAAYGRDRLFRNEGGFRFTDVTDAAGIDDPRWTVAAAFLDVDWDGDLDLYVVGYLDMPIEAHMYCGTEELRSYCHVDSWDGIPDRLWINDGSGRFADGTAAAGIADIALKGLAVVASDLDGDADLDLFVANDSTANTTLRNEGGGRFTDVGRLSGTDYNAEGKSEACMGVDSGDLDGDGDPDLYVVNFQQESNTLYRNDGGFFFTDTSVRSGAGVPSIPELGFGCVFFDVENDADLDIYVANGHIMDNIAEVESLTSYPQPDHLYLNDGTGTFALAEPSLAPSLVEPRVGRALARGDLDGDGDHDLVITHSNDAPRVLRNDLADGRRVVLVLGGPGGRADAEGARVELLAGGRRIVRELVGGGSYLGHSDAALVIGLGDAARVERLAIRWPGGPTSEHEDLEADRVWRFGWGGEVLGSEPLPAPSR